MNFTNLKQLKPSTATAQAIFRIGAFALLAAVIVLLFPRYNNAFRYHFELGKPWGYSTLTADFDFPIYKTDEQVNKEQKQLLSTFAPCYKYLKGTQRQVLVVSLQEREWLESEHFNRIAVMQGKVAKTYPLSEVYTPMTAHKQFGYDCEKNLVRDTALTDTRREQPQLFPRAAFKLEILHILSHPLLLVLRQCAEDHKRR